MPDDRVTTLAAHPLTVARSAAGLSVEQLARIADLEPSVLTAIETRRQRPTLSELNLLAQALRLRIVDLRE